MAFLTILVLVILAWFVVRWHKEKTSKNVPAVFRQRSQAGSPEQNAPVATESDLDRCVRLCNDSIEKFDHTDDPATKFYEMRLLEKNLKELLRISPEHQAARQVEQMMPEMRRKIEAKLVASHKTHPSSETNTDWLTDIEQTWQRGDYDTARQMLQKIAYGMVGPSVTEDQRADFTRLMSAFAKEDPLYKQVMDRVLPMVQANPGMLQSQIYKGQPDHIKEQMRYVLYFANELGHIQRIKKGNSYKLMLPDDSSAGERVVDNGEVVTRVNGMKNLDLLKQYAEQHLGHPLEQAKPIKLNGDQVSEVLWPLNDLFRPNLAAIQSLAYDARYEREADSAIADFAFAPDGYDWSALSSGAWRVFMERHYQTLMLSGLQLQTPFLSVPLNLPERARLGFLLLFQYHGMPLPFPVQDRSSAALPQPNAPVSLRRH